MDKIKVITEEPDVHNELPFMLVYDIHDGDETVKEQYDNCIEAMQRADELVESGHTDTAYVCAILQIKTGEVSHE